jgi:pimeloyl-ACP methyl ester carboxylesterase
MKRAAVLVFTLAAALACVAPAGALHQAGHIRPQGPAKVRFADDFPVLRDDEWGFRIGGFGGVAQGAPLGHVPVIFVHGNTVDHADWYPVRDAFRAAGWADQELWALSYNGLGRNAGAGEEQLNPERDEEHREMGNDGVSRITNNDLNVPDLHAFIEAVRTYTGSAKFSIVSHSLGVTVARKTLKVHPELRADLVAFVSIAGGNHGTSLCPPGTQGIAMSCDEIAAGTEWLDRLNGPGGSDETYAPARWLSIYDSSGTADVGYLSAYADSPRLRGADNRPHPGTQHNDLRLTPSIVAEYREFLEDAERPALPSLSPPAPAPAPRPPAAPKPSIEGAKRGGLPATRVGAAAVPALVCLVLALAFARALRRGDQRDASEVAGHQRIYRATFLLTFLCQSGTAYVPESTQGRIESVS